MQQEAVANSAPHFLLPIKYIGSRLDLVHHFDRGLNGGFRLVSVEAAGLKLGVVVPPRDDRLNEGIGAAAGRDGHGVVGEHGKGSSERLVDLAEGTDKSVILAVATGRLLVGLTVDLDLEGGHRAETLRQGERVVENADAVAVDVVAEHVGDDVGEVFLGQELLLVA